MDLLNKLSKQQPQRSLSAWPGSVCYKEAVGLYNVTFRQKSTRNYADLFNVAIQRHNTMQAEKNNLVSADSGFILVTDKHKDECAVNKFTNQAPVASKKSRTPMFGVGNILLFVTDRKTECMCILVLHFIPEITSQDKKITRTTTETFFFNSYQS